MSFINCLFFDPFWPGGAVTKTLYLFCKTSACRFAILHVYLYSYVYKEIKLLTKGASNGS